MNQKRFRQMRERNFYFNEAIANETEPTTVSGRMGERDPETGRYFTTLDNGGSVSSDFIGLSDSRPQGYRTELDLNGWADN